MDNTYNTPLIYTPQQAQTPSSAPTPEYTLINDLSGKPPPRKGPYNIIDHMGRKFTMPHEPTANCKRCCGKGYVGIDTKSKKIIICHKCYKNIK